MGTAFSAQKSTLSVGSNATPPVWTKIGGIVSFTGLDGASSDIDTTDLDSEAKESMPGLADPGTFNFNVNTNRADPGQIALEAARVASATVPFQLTLPDGSIGTWKGYVKTTPLAGGVDAVLTGAVTTKISGPVAWQAPGGGA